MVSSKVDALKQQQLTEVATDGQLTEVATDGRYKKTNGDVTKTSGRLAALAARAAPSKVNDKV